MDLGVSAHPNSRSFTGRDMLQVSHIRWGILLVLSTCVPAHASSCFLDQWLVDSSRCLDDCSQCHIWYLSLYITPPSIIHAISQELHNWLLPVLEYTTLSGLQHRGKHARLQFHVARFSSYQFTIHLDVIFLGITAVACIFCLFFNKYLPAIDVSTRL
jgi:hypothetical protein